MERKKDLSRSSAGSARSGGGSEPVYPIEEMCAPSDVVHSVRAYERDRDTLAPSEKALERKSGKVIVESGRLDQLQHD